MYKLILKVIAISLILTGCNSSFAKKYGSTPRPDEFSIKKNPPLVIPKKFDLPPPSNAIETNATNEDTSLSAGEKNLLNKTNNLELDPNIQNKLDKKNKPNILKRIF